MSDVLGVRKVDAMATLFPAMFTLIERGKQVWGSRTRLEYLWNIVRSASVENLPIVAHEGIRVLLKHWRIAGTSISPSDIDLIVQRSICRWGGGLPMLSGIRSNDVCDLLKLCIPAVTLDKHNSQDHPGSRMETSKPYNV
jgi:putative alcohol dehydrogenase